MSSSTANVVVRAQTHRPRYHPGDPVKCHVHLHAVGKWFDANAAAALSNGVGRSHATSPSSTPPGTVPFETTKLYPDALRQALEQPASKSHHPASAVATVHDATVQLAGYCCWDKNKMAVQHSDVLHQCGLTLLPPTSTDAVSRTPSDPAMNGAPPRVVSEALRSQLFSSEVLGRNESMSLQWVSNPAAPFHDEHLLSGESVAASMLFLLPSDLVMPSFRGQSIRIAFMVVVSVCWSPATPHAPRRTTVIRVPVKVHSTAVALRCAPSLRSLHVAGGLGRHALMEPFADEDGSVVMIPSQPSPAVCPPLHDMLVPCTPNRRQNPQSAMRTPSVDFALGSSSDSVGRRRCGVASVDAELGRRARACAAPTDYVIRYNDVQTMNLLLESTVVPLGSSLCGVYVALPVASSGIRVGRITLSIECLELTEKRFLAKGASASGAKLPAVLAESSASSKRQGGAGGGGVAADNEKLVLNVTTVEERDWFVLDAVQTPFDVCFTPTKFQQTLRTHLVSVEWMARWRFWCVEGGQTPSVGVGGSTGAGAAQQVSSKRKLKEFYQELELPITVLPPIEGQNPRMGPPVFGA